MQGGLVVCLDSGLLLWQRSIARNFGISGRTRDVLNLGAFLFALYGTSSLIRQHEPKQTFPEGHGSEDSVIFDMGHTTLYLRANHTERTLCALFVHSQVSRGTADALSHWMCSQFTKKSDRPRFWRSIHANMSYMLKSMAHPLVCAALDVRLGCKQSWLLVVREEDLKVSIL